MQTATLTAVRPKTKTQVRAGLVISAIPVLFLLFDSVIKLAVIDPVIVSLTQLGYPVSLAVTIGIVELACLALYVNPRTSIVGAILLTGYLGGAVATHVRVGSPLLSHVLFPLYIAAMLWGGLYLLDDRLRSLLTARR